MKRRNAHECHEKKLVVNQLCRQRSDKLHKIKTNEILSAGIVIYS